MRRGVSVQVHAAVRKRYRLPVTAQVACGPLIRRRFPDAEVWCGTSAVIHRPGGPLTLRSNISAYITHNGRRSSVMRNGEWVASEQCRTANQDHPQLFLSAALWSKNGGF